MLSTRSATALYVGAVLGPGVLLLPALAARIAGPASVLAWAGLLALSIPLAITFAALGVRWPEAGGTASYVRAAFGARAGRATGWWFLTGVAVGAPAVALIGGFYVAELIGGGRTTAVIAGAAMIAAVLLANSTGLHTTARLQLGLAGLLGAMLLVAVLTALPHTEAENWTPFAPHGWGAIGSAASVLMFAFFGWEAVSHLAGELRDPAKQLPRAIFSALTIVAVLYLGLAAATIGVGAHSDVPLADLMASGLGETGRKVTAVLAVLLTMGTMNTYMAAASQLAGTLVPGSRPLPWIGAVAARPARGPGGRPAQRRRADEGDERDVRGGLRGRDGGRGQAPRTEARGSPRGSGSWPSSSSSASPAPYILVPLLIGLSIRTRAVRL